MPTCPKCHSPNDGNARFCSQCGAALSPASLEKAGPKAERKLVTVLFSDLTGYTALSEKLDPEDTRKIMADIFSQAADIVGRYGGTIEKFIGDAIMAIFGVPESNEDDASRAVRAALELHRAVDALAPAIEARAGARVALHSGINSGLVVTGELKFDRGTAGPLGDTINVAARLMNVAESGDICVGPQTRRLLGSAFEFDDLGQHSVKGKSSAIAVSRIVGFARSRDDERPGLSSFVGRDEELGILLGAVERLRDGQGGAIALCADAGNGKSRLVQELRLRAGDDLQWLEGRAYPYAENIPFFPLVDLLNWNWAIREDDSTDTVRQKVEAGVAAAGADTDDILPIVARLYHFDVDGAPVVDREAYKGRLFEAVQQLLAGLAKRSPAIVCLQDLHWADASSSELIARLLTNPQPGILFVCNFRPGFEVPDGVRCVTLKELSPRQTANLVSSILSQSALPDALIRFVVERSDGNPFYVEELINSLTETGTLVKTDGLWTLADNFSESAVPSTIRGVIAARIDRLPEKAHRVLQEAAVVGREFLYDVLESISDQERPLEPCLVGLQSVDLIHKKARQPELEYMFKHALTQEVAYRGLLRTERNVLHERVGLALESLLGERTDEYSETLAYHFQRGGDASKAVRYLIRAGAKCVGKYALDEAASHFQAALELLADRERSADEDRSLIELLVEWTQVHYYLGTNKDLLALLTTYESVAEGIEDAELKAMFLSCQGLALYFDENLHGSRDKLERALKIADEIGSDRVAVYANTWITWTLWTMGDLSGAIEAGEAASAQSSSLPDDHYAFFKCLAGVACAAIAAGDLERGARIGDQLIEFADTSGNARAAVAGHVCHAARHLANFDFDAQIDACREAETRAVDPTYRQWARMYLALGLAFAERADEARVVLDDLMMFTGTNDMRLWHAVVRIADAMTKLAVGELSAGMRELERLADYYRENDGLFGQYMVAVVTGVVYARVARGEAQAGAGVLARNAGFVLKHALRARSKALGMFDRVLDPARDSDLHGMEAIVRLEYAATLAHAGKHDGAREQLAKARPLLEKQHAKTALVRADALAAELGIGADAS